MVCGALKGPVSRVFQGGVNLFYYMPLRQAVSPLASEVKPCHREPSAAATTLYSSVEGENKPKLLLVINVRLDNIRFDSL